MAPLAIVAPGRIAVPAPVSAVHVNPALGRNQRQPHLAAPTRTASGARFVLALAAVGASSRRCQKGRGRDRGGVVVRAEASEDDFSLTQARAAAEAAKLELQAAKLRMEADALERESQAERRSNRARLLLADETLLEVAMLPDRLKQVDGILISEAQATELAATRGEAVEASSPLGFEDLSSKAFEEVLQRIVLQEQLERRQRILREQELARQEAERRRREPQVQTFEIREDENQDNSVGTRLLACLAYLLPLTDAVRYMAPLVAYFPVFAPLYILLSIPASIIHAIPLGSLILFIAVSALSNNRDLPRLLRFNLQQAVLVDVALFLPGILLGLLAMINGEGGGENFQWIEAMEFIFVLIASGYSMAVTLFLGKDPDGIPAISDATKRSLDRNY